MHAWEGSSGTGTSRRSNRDFDDFDELDHDELAHDEENEFAVRCLEDADDELYEAEVENELPRS